MKDAISYVLIVVGVATMLAFGPPAPIKCAQIANAIYLFGDCRR